MKNIGLFIAVLLSSTLVSAEISETLSIDGKQLKLTYSEKTVSTSGPFTRWTFKKALFEVVSGFSGVLKEDTYAVKVNTGRPTSLGIVCDLLSDGLYPIFKAYDYSGGKHIKNHGAGLFFFDFSPSQYLVFSDVQSPSGEWRTSVELEDYDPTFHDPQYWRNIVCSDDDTIN